MTMTVTRPSAIGTIAVALTLVCALAACKGKNEYAGGDVGKPDSTAPDMAPPAVPTPAMDQPMTPPPATGWTSPTILGFATVANSGEIEMGKLGERTATSPAVKAFATMMVKDHEMMLKEVTALATKVSATADTTADNARDLANHASDELKDLSAKTGGPDWDKNFMDKMIDDHKKVLDKLQDAAKTTTDPDVRAGLEKTTGKVQQHLTKAQDVRKQLKS
jgi:putative membrane protein